MITNQRNVEDYGKWVTSVTIFSTPYCDWTVLFHFCTMHAHDETCGSS